MGKRLQCLAGEIYCNANALEGLLELWVATSIFSGQSHRRANLAKAFWQIFSLLLTNLDEVLRCGERTLTKEPACCIFNTLCNAHNMKITSHTVHPAEYTLCTGAMLLKKTNTLLRVCGFATALLITPPEKILCGNFERAQLVINPTRVFSSVFVCVF